MVPSMTAAEREWNDATECCPHTEARERPVVGGSRRPDLYVIHRFRPLLARLCATASHAINVTLTNQARK
jgi:hypothetical protein